jgi:hypothetical protein
VTVGSPLVVLAVGVSGSAHAPNLASDRSHRSGHQRIPLLTPA